MLKLISFILLLGTCSTSASVLLPPLHATTLADLNRRKFSSATVHQRQSSSQLTIRGDYDVAMAIPGYGLTEQVLIGGMLNFFQLYNFIITARVLLSWFPQASSIGLLQPVYAVTDPYLNLFRGIVPPIGGLDLSPLLAFFTLNVLSSTTASIGCEIPDRITDEQATSRNGFLARMG